MAHAATLGSLTDGLIESITPWTHEKNGRRFKQSKDTALKAFRFQQHPRTNPFDVKARLEGLEEKFIVLNREPLADALRVRLDELSQQSSKCLPDILSLLLNLSDRPADNTNLAVLEEEDEDVNALPQLTWADIIAEDPLTEEGIWDDVLVESDYSDDETYSLGEGSLVEHTTSTQASFLADEDVAAFARNFIIPKDDTVLEHLEKTQIKLRRPTSDEYTLSSTQVSDLQAIREALLMLLGLPTTLFLAVSALELRPRPHYHTSTCDPSTFSHLMQDFAALGSQLARLRNWATSPPKGELPQRLSAAVQRKLRYLRKDFALIEQQFLSSDGDIVVSLLGVLSKVQILCNPLLCLATAISQTDPDAAAWAILDSLFDATCSLQLADQNESFVYVASVFFECLEVYCSSIHLWMTQGKLQDQDDRFFVQSNTEHFERGSLWHSRYTLSRRSDGTASAPRFMQTAANKIFTAGKSVMFLEALQHERQEEAVDNTKVQGLDADSVMSSLHNSLLPFAGVFEQELQKWIAAQQNHNMPNLRETLFSKCGLADTLAVITQLFMASDGARFQDFANELFIRIDRKRPWTDRFILTELAQTTLGLLKCLDAERISVRLSQQSSTLATYSSPIISLDRLRIDYTISWPLRNVMADFSICQRVFVASLHVYRAEYLLTKQQWSMVSAKNHRGPRMRQALALRHRLVWFTATYRGYIAEVNVTTMRELRAGLESTRDMDGMAEAYDNFQRDLEGRLLLRKNLRPIQQSLLSLLKICEDFGILWEDLVGEPDSNATDKQKERSRKDLVDVGDFSDEEINTKAEVRERTVRDASALSQDYERQLHFAIAGLRGVSRVGGESAWIALAERLQLGNGYGSKR